VIIRKTLVYAALTATLGLVFFAGWRCCSRWSGVSRDGRFTGDHRDFDSADRRPVHAAASPHPGLIDRRFYRQKYNAEQALAEFAEAARNETDLGALTGKLLELVSQTMQLRASLCLG